MAPEPLAIGEWNGEIFSCPACARPLAEGAGRCPGCGTRLLLGVQARRAAFFLAAGAVAGMFVGGLVMTAAILLSRPGAAVAPIPAPVAVPSAVPAQPGVTLAPVPPEPAIPAIATSALGQAATIHIRLSTAGTSLEVFLAAEDLDTSAVARALRSIASDAANGSSLAPRVGQWDEAAELSRDLAAFYTSVREVAREGLRASVSHEAAYREAGEEMLQVLTGLGALDADTRALAADADVDLPPPTEPLAAAAP